MFQQFKILFTFLFKTILITFLPLIYKAWHPFVSLENIPHQDFLQGRSREGAGSDVQEVDRRDLCPRPVKERLFNPHRRLEVT